MKSQLLYSLLALGLAGCSALHTDTSGSTVMHRFVQPPQAAAACFARNADAHSSALIAEVRPPDARGAVEVVVHVKNGVTYASAVIRPLGMESEGTITLMASSIRGSRELVGSLVEGC